jgi:hypothetical protein
MISVSVYIPIASLLAIQLALNADLGRLSAIIRRGNLLEPWVLQCLVSGDAVLRIVDKYLLQEVEEVLREAVVLGNDFLDCCEQ